MENAAGAFTRVLWKHLGNQGRPDSPFTAHTHRHEKAQRSDMPDFIGKSS